LHGSLRDFADFADPVPARCAQLLAQDEADVALVPVIEYQRIPDVSLIPNVCVGSKEEVRSVILISRNRELNDVRSVALDESSRTSVTLVKIIFAEFLKSEPAWSTRSSNLDQMLDEADAALMIGDPAMVLPREGLRVWDLARLWRHYTGFGFVFAMWAVRKEAMARARRISFADARDEGLSHKEQIVEQYHQTLGIQRESLREYLDENISFTVDDQLRSGLNLYFKLAHKHALLTEVKPLITLEP
jgi:chorismate dehydratase